MSHNLAKLPAEQRRQIELDRQAALLIYRRRKGAIARTDIEAAITALPEQERAPFRARLNHYQQTKENP